MKKEVAEAWVKDLRTNPPQCTGDLYDGVGYCCLGRLALVLGAKFESNVDAECGYALDCGEDGVLTQALADAAGMKTRTGSRAEGQPLTAINDDGATFSEIADIIEKEWEDL